MQLNAGDESGRMTRPGPAAGFTLEIAGVTAAVEISDPDVAEELAQRYVDFLSASAPAWRLAMVIHADEYVPGAPAWIRHEGPVTHFHVFGLRGVIDLTEHTATVDVPNRRQAASALERTMTYILMQTLPREHDGLLLHSVGVVMNEGGAGYIFAGHSGAGKSTVAGLAAGVAEVLSDENMVLRLTPAGAKLYSTPFWGQSTPPERVRRVNRSAPLAGIFMLEHGPDFTLTPLRPGEAVSELLSTEKVATERVTSADVWLAMAGRLAASVPIYRLAFRPTAELWDFLKEAAPSA